ncbi:DUF6332 family protein [Streptomyces sp. NPDC094448]|uniref:DUF6332 family protein n=1 Tax=Streptomyces sp. NPDC094448 TaxID=3366063 RepID=UPI0037F62FB6
MDTGRESRWEKDAMTVEIVFALVTALAAAAGIYAAVWTVALVSGIPDPGRTGLLAGGALLGAAAGLRRLVRVLRRFDKQRRMGR